MNIQKKNCKSPSFFIVGSGRSGTTLFKVLLSKLDEFDVPDESSFLVRAYMHLSHRCDYTDDDYKFAARVFCEWSIDAWGMSEEDILTRLRQDNPKTYKNLNNSIYSLYYDGRGDYNLWGIKKPVFILQLERLIDVYPNAKIIHVVRDVRDTYLSFNNIHERADVRSFGPKRPITVALYWRYGLTLYQKVPQNLRIELRYEDLIDDPDACLEQVSRHFDFQWKSKEKISRDSVFGGSSVSADLLETIHSKLQEPVDTGNKNKYIREMTPTQIFIVELISADLMVQYDYELQFPFLAKSWLNPIRSLLNIMTSVVYKVRYYLRDSKVSRS